MDFKIALEWNEECGVTRNEIDYLRDLIEGHFKNKDYGRSISSIWIVMSCLGRDIKQRKRYQRAKNHFEYDIIFDFFFN